MRAQMVLATIPIMQMGLTNKFNFEAENKALSLEWLGAAFLFLVGGKNFVCDVSNAAVVVVQVFKNLELPFGQLRELSRGVERYNSLPEIDRRGGPFVLQCLRQMEALAPEKRLSGLCVHGPEHTACLN